MKEKNRVAREMLLAISLLSTGIILLPAAIYLVGSALFGEYGGTGLFDFYRALYGEMLSGELAVWFLLCSPYLVWLSLRFTIRHWSSAKE